MAALLDSGGRWRSSGKRDRWRQHLAAAVGPEQGPLAVALAQRLGAPPPRPVVGRGAAAAVYLRLERHRTDHWLPTVLAHCRLPSSAPPPNPAEAAENFSAAVAWGAADHRRRPRPRRWVPPAGSAAEKFSAVAASRALRGSGKVALPKTFPVGSAVAAETPEQQRRWLVPLLLLRGRLQLVSRGAEEGRPEAFEPVLLLESARWNGADSAAEQALLTAAAAAAGVVGPEPLPPARRRRAGNAGEASVPDRGRLLLPAAALAPLLVELARLAAGGLPLGGRWPLLPEALLLSALDPADPATADRWSEFRERWEALPEGRGPGGPRAPSPVAENLSAAVRRPGECALQRAAQKTVQRAEQAAQRLEERAALARAKALAAVEATAQRRVARARAAVEARTSARVARVRVRTAAAAEAAVAKVQRRAEAQRRTAVAAAEAYAAARRRPGAEVRRDRAIAAAEERLRKSFQRVEEARRSGAAKVEAAAAAAQRRADGQVAAAVAAAQAKADRWAAAAIASIGVFRRKP